MHGFCGYYCLHNLFAFLPKIILIWGRNLFSILIMYTLYPHIHIFSKKPGSLDFWDFFGNLAISICVILCYTFTCFKEYINR